MGFRQGLGKIVFGGVALVTLWAPSQSQGIVQAHVNVGWDSATISSDPLATGDYSENGTMFRVGAYVDPIPLVPVAFGLTVGLPTYTGTLDGAVLAGKNVGATTTGALVNLEVKGWAPVGFMGLTPYGRLGFLVSGGYVRTGGVTNLPNAWGGAGASAQTYSGELKEVFESSGFGLGLGVRYGVVPLVGVVGEFALRQESLTAKTVSVGGLPLDLADKKKTTLSATTLFVGVEVAL